MDVWPKIKNQRGLMLVLSSPSGAGKTTISRALIDRNQNLIMSVSVTTRSERPGEQNGKDYFFVDQKGFDEMVDRGDFLEYATVFGKSYGTPRYLVEKFLSQGNDVLFDVDWQGAQQLKYNAGDDLVSIFILPPSLKDLENRLRSRAQDNNETVLSRMANATAELSHWEEYDYIIVNQDLKISILQVEAIFLAERLKRSRQVGLASFVRSLKVKN